MRLCARPTGRDRASPRARRGTQRRSRNAALSGTSTMWLARALHGRGWTPGAGCATGRDRDSSHGGNACTGANCSSDWMFRTRRCAATPAAAEFSPSAAGDCAARGAPTRQWRNRPTRRTSLRVRWQPRPAHAGEARPALPRSDWRLGSEPGKAFTGRLAHVVRGVAGRWRPAERALGIAALPVSQ